MRYLDTGGRDPEDALGFWLRENVLEDESIEAVRAQSGFFSADVLGYFIPAFDRLGAGDGHTALLIGSNDGTTRRADIAAVLALVGPPRTALRVGVVRFSSGYFHPKSVHLTRDDGSQCAYVGSANLTGNGAANHVEAGLALDTRDGDDPAVLGQMAAAIDKWFDEKRSGLSVVAIEADLDALVTEGVLDVPRPARQRRPSSGGAAGAKARSTSVLTRLLALPALPEEIAASLRTTKITAAPEALEGGVSSGATTPTREGPTAPGPSTGSEDWWAKVLKPSDAQRKPTGNNRGSITLVQGLRRGQIDHETFFRDDLFAEAIWVPEKVRGSNKLCDVAVINFRTHVLGDDLGTVGLEVSYETSRNQGTRRNYTTLLHLEGLSDRFHADDMTGKVITIRRLTDGSFTLDITEQESE